MKQNKTRMYAMEIIYRVRFQQAYLNKELQNIQDLSVEDQRLLTTLTYGVIKKYDYLKAILLQQVEQLKIKKKTEVLILIAFYQFLFLDRVPDYAILNTTIELVKKTENQHVANFVNALLRRVLKPGILTLDTKDMETSQILALQYSMSEWLIKLLLAQYGQKDTLFFLKAVEQPPKQFLRFNTLKIKTPVFSEAIIETAVPNSAEYMSGNAAQTPAFLNGEFTIQNLSSQQVGYFVNPQKYDKILDMCAAPGGKTTHLSELTEDTADITAIDLYEHRVKQIEENAERLGIQGITVQTVDARMLSFSEPFDKVLLDAPCSGLGVLAQKPEIRYHITPEQLDALILLQQELLMKAWSLIKVGGELIYSTCTINRKENEKQIAWFIKNYPQAELIAEQYIFDEMQFGYAGFYMAKIKKQGEINENNNEI